MTKKTTSFNPDNSERLDKINLELQGSLMLLRQLLPTEAPVSADTVQQIRQTTQELEQISVQLQKFKSAKLLRHDNKCLQEMFQAINNYRDRRKTGPKTYHFLSFFQFTCEHKLCALESLEYALRYYDGYINPAQRAALLNGQLYQELNKIYKTNQVELNNFLKIQSTSFAEFLININQQDPIGTLIHILESRKSKRMANLEDNYYPALIPQHTRSEKIVAIANFISILSGVTDSAFLVSFDIEVLSSGSLGQSLKVFIKECGKALCEALKIPLCTDLSSLFNHFRFQPESTVSMRNP